MQLDRRRLVHPDQRKLVEVGLCHAALLERDLGLRGIDSVDDAALYLIHRAGGVDDLTADVDGDPDLVDLEGAVVSDRYDQLSLLRTIEVLLGLAPLNRTDALAVPMYSIFTDQPDFTPYERPLLSSHLSPADKEKAMR